jgi:PadR family transcriptional regulator, regulatory protein PadR
MQIGKAAGLAPGLMYPPLARLERMGAAESKWEDGRDGGKPRRLYRITGLGQRTASEAARPSRKRRRLRLPALGLPERQMA